MAPEPYPTDGVDGLGDVAPVNLCQFPAKDQGRTGSVPGTQPCLPGTQMAPSPDALTLPSYVSPLSWPPRYCCGVSCPGFSAVPSSPWRSRWG